MTSRQFLALSLAWVALVGVAVAIASGGLGNDEAQYALGARDLVGGDAPDPYPLFRSIGMRVLTAPGVLAGGGDVAIRLPFVLVSVAYAALVWHVARRVGNDQTAVIALAVQVTSPLWLMRTGEALSDIAAAGLLLAMIALVLDDRDRPRARARAWIGVAAAGAAAFYIRYGSAPVIAIIFAITLVACPARRRETLAAAVAVAIAVVPFLVWSEARTGDVLGVLHKSEAAANRAYLGEGLLWYVTRWPYAVAGPVMGLVAAFGVYAGLRTPGITRVLVVVALGQIALLGVFAHGEERYVFLATSVLVIAGAGWIAARPRLRTAVFALCAVSAILGSSFAVARSYHMARRREALLAATDAIRADANGARCLVFTGTRPQVAWYTRCRTQLIDSEPAHVPAARGYARVYLVSAEGSPRQPESGTAASAPTLEFKPLVSGHDPDWFVWRAR